MARIFVSYAREDQPAAAAFVDGLGQAGHDVWWDQRLGGGEVFRKTIENEIRAADVAMVVWSRRASASNWVNDEAGLAAQRGILLPVRIDDAPPPLGFGAYNVLDFSDGNADLAAPGWKHLLDSVDRLARAPRVPDRRVPLSVLPQALGLGLAWGSVLGTVLWLLHRAGSSRSVGSILGHPLIDLIATGWIACLPVAIWSAIQVRLAGFESALAISRRAFRWFTVGAVAALVVLVVAVVAGAGTKGPPDEMLIELSRVFVLAAMSTAFVVTSFNLLRFLARRLVGRSS